METIFDFFAFLICAPGVMQVRIYSELQEFFWWQTVPDASFGYSHIPATNFLFY